MADWPGNVPFFDLRSGFSHVAEDDVLRTPMDVGPTKARRRSASGPQAVTGSAYMTRAEYLLARAFVRNTLKGGALSFTAPDPVTGLVVNYRLTEPLSLAPMGCGWRVSASLEILP